MPELLERYRAKRPREMAGLRIAQDLASAKNLQAACEGLAGNELLAAIDARLEAEPSKAFRAFARLCCREDDTTSTAGEMYAQVRRLLSLPPCARNRVVVGQYAQPRFWILGQKIQQLGYFPWLHWQLIVLQSHP